MQLSCHLQVRRRRREHELLCHRGRGYPRPVDEGAQDLVQRRRTAADRDQQLDREHPGRYLGRAHRG